MRCEQSNEDADDVVRITRRINGGVTDAAQRVRACNAALEAVQGSATA